MKPKKRKPARTPENKALDPAPENKLAVVPENKAAAKRRKGGEPRD